MRLGWSAEAEPTPESTLPYIDKGQDPSLPNYDACAAYFTAQRDRDADLSFDEYGETLLNDVAPLGDDFLRGQLVNLVDSFDGDAGDVEPGQAAAIAEGQILRVCAVAGLFPE